jgi:hypothetical protein
MRGDDRGNYSANLQAILPGGSARNQYARIDTSSLFGLNAAVPNFSTPLVNIFIAWSHFARTTAAWQNYFRGEDEDLVLTP